MAENDREFGELKAKVDDLMRWRDVFEADIKESLRSLDGKIDREMRDMGAEIRAIRQEIGDALRSATNRLPVWAAVTGGVILAVAGWFVEWAIFTGH